MRYFYRCPALCAGHFRKSPPLLQGIRVEYPGHRGWWSRSNQREIRGRIHSHNDPGQ